jgi:ornithine--oxo-acid transaminase
MQEQLRRITLTSRAFHNDQFPLFARELCELTAYDMLLPMNTGAEAVETALKVARKWGYMVKGVPADTANIIVAQNNFHGRTTTLVSFSSVEQYRAGFGPLTPGFTTVPFGNAQALEAAITPDTVAFLVEPIQGEAGVVIPPDGYLQQASVICKKHNVLWVVDEVQSGLGRTGKLLACDHEHARPDILILGKALGGGLYPVSAVLASREILGILQPGDHGSTFGGNPLGCAIAREAIRVLQEEQLAARSAELGQVLLKRLLLFNNPLVESVRGRGLWAAIVLKPEAGKARRYTTMLAKKGLLCKETHENIIRLAPPLVIAHSELDWALDQIETVLMVPAGN